MKCKFNWTYMRVVRFGATSKRNIGIYTISIPGVIHSFSEGYSIETAISTPPPVSLLPTLRSFPNSWYLLHNISESWIVQWNQDSGNIIISQLNPELLHYNIVNLEFKPLTFWLTNETSLSEWEVISLFAIVSFWGGWTTPDLARSL